MTGLEVHVAEHGHSVSHLLQPVKPCHKPTLLSSPAPWPSSEPSDLSLSRCSTFFLLLTAGACWASGVSAIAYGSKCRRRVEKSLAGSSPSKSDPVLGCINRTQGPCTACIQQNKHDGNERLRTATATGSGGRRAVPGSSGAGWATGPVQRGDTGQCAEAASGTSCITATRVSWHQAQTQDTLSFLSPCLCAYAIRGDYG